MAASDGIGSAIGEKLGPLPVWAWGAIAGAGILVATKLRKPKAAAVDLNTPGPGNPGTPAASSSSSPDVSFMAAGTYVPPGGSGYTPGVDTNVAAPLSDNGEWLRTATTLVAARNTSLTMTGISEALSKYLDGRPMSESEAAIVELALRAVGQPPYQPPPITISSPASQAPPTTTTPTPSAPAAPAAPAATAPAGVAVTAAFPNGRPILSIGSSGPPVKAAALWLGVNVAGHQLAAERSEVFDAELMGVVSSLQAFMGAPVSGTIDANTWGIMDYIGATRGSPVPTYASG